jgi:hypothetical protein
MRAVFYRHMHPRYNLSIVWNILRKFFKVMLILLAGGVILSRSGLLLSDPVELVRKYTRNFEFDFVNWTIQALFIKNQNIAINLDGYLPEDSGREILEKYFDQVSEIERLRWEISTIYSDPNISDPDLASRDLTARLDTLEAENKKLGSLSEAVLQQQISIAAAELDLSAGGQLIPPLLYHVTPLPMALVVSPRDSIRQDADISLHADLKLEQIVALEQRIEEELNVSALVVNIGGVGIYPTMVLRTTNLAWMIETIAHEWVHNFLTLRPLGTLYGSSPQLRTINETTASLAGKEIALWVYEQFYPQFVPADQPPAGEQAPKPSSEPVQAPVFDFRQEMHETRITVDAMLAAGALEEAEAYMEARRIIFRQNGYQIRRINQAYFAFYGAYADTPGGAAGEDPVGPAVRALRQQSNSMADFLNRISWITSFESLLEEIAIP